MKNTLGLRSLASSVASIGLIASGAIAMTSLPTAAFAQDYTTGGIEGVVLDDLGSPVAGAVVTLVSDGRGQSRTTTTDANGEYRFTRLAIGSYTISANGNVVENQRVRVNGFTNVTLAPETDEVIATGQLQSSLLVNDFSVNQLGLVVDVDEVFETQPIARNLASLALLAPGTTGGDSAFGNLASISGSSVAENAYYINGFNTTDFRNFVGSSAVPFEFYDQVETKTGGYAAEFGRSTGGVINAVTKSGTNDFKFGVNAYWEPNELRASTPTTAGQSTVGFNSATERDDIDGSVWASGPIIKDKLFFFGLYNFQDFEAQTFSRDLQNPTGDNLAVSDSGRTTITRNNDPFYGAKLDFYPLDNHHLEYTFIRDENTTETLRGDVTYSGNEISSIELGEGVGSAGSGGDIHIGKYTGNFGDNLTVSLLYGNQTFDQTTRSSADDIPVIINFGGAASITGFPFFASDYVNFLVSSGDDKREAFRADVDYYLDDFLGNHHFRVGVDREDLTATDVTGISGGIYYAYYNAAQCDGFAAQGGATPANHTSGNDCVRIRDFANGGTFETRQTAFYIQDAWEVTENLTLNLGLRNETFDNRDAAGNTFAKLSNQWAPRIGAAYTLPESENTQLFGSYGRYYLPVAANTNIRLAGAETFIQTYFDISGVNADRTPQISGDQFLRRVTGDGSVGETSSLVNEDLDPMYVNEAIMGLRHNFDNGWETSLAFTYRDLASTLEDVAIDAGVLKFCEREGIVGCEDVWTGFHQYVLTNPGQDLRVTSTSGDIEALNAAGNNLSGLIDLELSAEDLGYPVAARTYKSAEVTAKKRFDWGLADISYTLSESIGNYEGSVKSDNGQDDAGLTQDFDQPGLVDGAYGLLPNHRAHKLKVRGFVDVTDEVVVGANYRLTSPRKFGCIGVHPTDVFAQAYGSASNFCGGQLVERGTAFDGDWVNQLDVSLSYTPEVVEFGKLTFRADFFNLFNLRDATDFQEFGENDSGVSLASYGRPSNYIAPRRVRLGVNFVY